MKRRRRFVAKADINVTPFIDILLVLLVIFMTITPLTPTGLPTSIPQTPPPGPREEPEKTVVLTMDRGGSLRINQKLVEPARLGEQLSQIFKIRSDRSIFVQADAELLFDDIARIIDIARGAGVNRVGLITEQISAR